MVHARRQSYCERVQRLEETLEMLEQQNPPVLKLVRENSAVLRKCSKMILPFRSFTVLGGGMTEFLAAMAELADSTYDPRCVQTYTSLSPSIKEAFRYAALLPFDPKDGVGNWSTTGQWDFRPEYRLNRLLQARIHSAQAKARMRLNKGQKAPKKAPGKAGSIGTASAATGRNHLLQASLRAVHSAQTKARMRKSSGRKEGNIRKTAVGTAAAGVRRHWPSPTKAAGSIAQDCEDDSVSGEQVSRVGGLAGRPNGSTGARADTSMHVVNHALMTAKHPSRLEALQKKLKWQSTLRKLHSQQTARASMNAASA